MAINLLSGIGAVRRVHGEELLRGRGAWRSEEDCTGQKSGGVGVGRMSQLLVLKY